MSFVEAPKVHEFPGVLHASIVEWLMFTHGILALGKEDSVRSQLLKIIKQLAQMARDAKA